MVYHILNVQYIPRVDETQLHRLKDVDTPT